MSEQRDGEGYGMFSVGLSKEGVVVSCHRNDGVRSMSMHPLYARSFAKMLVAAADVFEEADRSSAQPEEVGK